MTAVLEAQRAWAERNGYGVTANGYYLTDPSVGVFGRVEGWVVEQLAAGEGREDLRLHSLRSSAALAVNVFAPWA